MQPKPLTPEQQVQNQLRMIAQEVKSTAQGVLFNLMNNPNAVESHNPDELVAISIDTGIQFYKQSNDKLEALFDELIGKAKAKQEQAAKEKADAEKAEK